MTPVADLDALRAAADEADSRFAQHFDVCPTQRAGIWCRKCDELVAIVIDAESAYRRARLAGVAS